MYPPFTYKQLKITPDFLKDSAFKWRLTFHQKTTWAVQQMKNNKSVFAVMGYFKSFKKIWKPFSEETTDFNQPTGIQYKDKTEVLNASTHDNECWSAMLK